MDILSAFSKKKFTYDFNRLKRKGQENIDAEAVSPLDLQFAGCHSAA